MRLVLCLILGITLLAATSAMALYTEAWEMDVDMTSAGAGTINDTAMIMPAGAGTGTNGPDGFNYEDGIATFLDDSNSSGNQGVALIDTGNVLLGTGGYTVDMSIRWLAGNDGTGSQRAMGFAGAAGQGRGVEFDQDNLYSKSSGWVASGPGGQNYAEWSTWRVVVQSNGLFTIYRYMTTDVLLASPSAGDTPTRGYIGDNFGFFLGSLSGSGTSLSSYELDWVRVAQGTDILADHNQPQITPEPGSMLALASGLIGMAGFAIRRRRA